MKKLSMLCVLSLSLSLPAFAEGWGQWGNGYAEAGAGASGVGFVYQDGAKGYAWTDSEGYAGSTAQTNPDFAAASSGLLQAGGFAGADTNQFHGEAGIFGATSAAAKVGRTGHLATTGTEGYVTVDGYAAGDRSSKTGGAGAVDSAQGSMAIDTAYGGYASSGARQSSIGAARSSAEGKHQAVSAASVSTGSIATSSTSSGKKH
jgi:hypothetical protein